jgi:linearmycin/streptolysin S transport system permease protein
MIDPGKVVEIARVNLLRQIRDRSDLFFVFVLPTLVIVALGLQFGVGGRARLGVVSPVGDPDAAALVAALGAYDTELDVRSIADEAELRTEVEHGQLEAGVIIPDGFGAGLRGTTTVEIRYVGTLDALTFGIRAPVEAAVAQANALATASRIGSAVTGATFDEAAAAASQARDAVPGVTVDVARVGEPGPFAGLAEFTLGASSQLVLFMFLTSMIAATRLVATRRLGVSRRMVAGPTSTATIVAGEALGRYAVALLQAAYIVVVTAIVFGVAWGDPIAAGALIALFGVVSAGAAMLVGSAARNADQAGSIGVFAGLALGALGGCMVPYQIMPASMQAIARLLPHSWALLGLQSLIGRGDAGAGAGLAAVAPNLAVQAVYGAVVMGIATWRFRRTIAG